MEINVAEEIKCTNMCELASKTLRPAYALTDSEKAVVAELDKKFKEIGRLGFDKDHEISAFITKAIQEDYESIADEVLGRMFDRNTIGEADDFTDVEIDNTLVSYEAAKGGNVPKSFLDPTVLTPKWHNRQVETDISYADLARNGWKTVATVVDYTRKVLTNDLLKDVFTDLDNAITLGADNYVAVGSTSMTQAAADAVALYLNEWGGDKFIIAYTKYISEISSLTGYASPAMLDELNRFGRLQEFKGCELLDVPSVRKQGDGSGLFLDKRVFGVSAKIGTLSMRGDIAVYQEDNINRENFHIKIAGFNYGYTFGGDAAKKVVKAVLQ